MQSHAEFPTTNPPGNPALRERVRVTAVGDIIFDRGVREIIDAEGPRGPLADVASILRRGEVTIANLENPLSARGSEWPGKGITFEGPPGCVKALTLAGVDAVSLGNNHIFDYGPVAAADTARLLDRNRIAHAGGGANAKEAWQPAVVRRGPKTIAYLAFSDVHPDGYVVAGPDSPGIAAGDENVDAIARAIRRAKAQADFVIVSLHWGIEYTDHPTDEQRQMAHRCVEAGADMIAAHHPHVIQGIEIYKKKLIAYSLGDFVFDHKDRKCGESFILQAVLSRRGTVSARAIPVYLTNAGKPSIVREEDARSILTRLADISADLGTQVRLEGDTAVVVRGR